MVKKKKRGEIDWLDREGLMDMTSVPPNSITAEGVHALYKTLSEPEQDELLTMLLSDGGLQRLSTVAQDLNTPGAVDLLLDNVEYYHFFRSVKEY